MNSPARTASTWPRVSRAYAGMATMPMAIIAFWICGPSADVMAIARISAGNARSASIPRMMMRSNLPPRYPAASPSDVPTSSPMDTLMRPTDSEIREPQSTRENTSRPRSSVPSQCVAFGDWSESMTFTLIGSNGAMIGANAATKSHASTMSPPTIMRGFRRKR